MNMRRVSAVFLYILDFSIGLLAVAAATAASLVFHSLAAATPLLFFLAAIIVSAWYGGLISGSVTAVLSLFSANYLFFMPQSLFRPEIAEFGRLVILVAFACIVFLLKRSRRQTFDELERSRNQLSIILRDVADGITMQDTSGKLVYANYEAARALGFLSSDVLLRTPINDVLQNFEILDEDGQPFPTQSLPGRLALLGMRYPEATIRFLNKKTGETRWSVVKARPVFDGKGNVQFAISLFQDITKSKSAEQTIFQQREQLRVTLASIGDGVIATDVQGNITFLNAIAAQITGWQEEEALGKPIQQVFQIMNEDSRQQVANPVERVLHEGSITGLANHTLLISKVGREIPINDSGAPIRDRDNNLIGTVLVFRDISEQRKAQIALEASESRYRNLVENASDMVYSLDLKGNLTSINGAGEQLLGYKREDIVGKSVAPLIAPESLAMMEEMLRKKIDGLEETTYVLELISRDGKRVPVEIRSRLMSDEKGISGIYGIARSISGRKPPEA